MKRSARGYTLFELVIVVVVAGLVGIVFFGRLQFYQEMAEKAAMESMLRTYKTGLQLRLAELIIANRQAEAARLESEDPGLWLDQRPANHGGEYRAQPAPGTWYFDAGARQLVYVVRTGRRLEHGPAEPANELRFQVRLMRDEVKVRGGVVEGVSGITLIPVYPYRWSGAAEQSILANLSQEYQGDAYGTS